MTLFEAKRFREFPLEALANVATRLIDTGMLIVFWVVVANFAQNGGIDIRRIVGFYLILGGLTAFFYQQFGIGSQLLKTIKSGELNQILLRPISPLIYPWTWRTGRNFVNLTFGAGQAVIGLIISDISWNGRTLGLLPVVIAYTFFINAAFNILVGVAAFHFVEARGIKNSSLHTVRLLRGEFIPLYLMPVGLASFLQFTPFPASQYHLVVLLQGKESLPIGYVLAGVFWAVAMMFIATRLWRAGIKKYEAIGI